MGLISYAIGKYDLTVWLLLTAPRCAVHHGAVRRRLTVRSYLLIAYEIKPNLTLSGSIIHAARIDISVRRPALRSPTHQTVTRKRSKDVCYIQIHIIMSLNDLQERLKRRGRREMVDEKEEEKAKILKCTSNMLEYRGYQ